MKKFTAKQEERAKRHLADYNAYEKDTVDRLAKKYGREPWEIVADVDVSAHGGALRILGGLPANAKQYPVHEVQNRDGSAWYAQIADGTIMIRLTGAIADNLHRAADAMNTVSWCDDDNTACDLLANFVFWQQMLNWGETGKHHFLNGLADEIGLIEDGIDTGAGDDKELDKKRKDELKAAFAKAFKFCEHPLMAKLTGKAK